jgi:hypothetical protein
MFELLFLLLLTSLVLLPSPLLLMPLALLASLLLLASTLLNILNNKRKLLTLRTNDTLSPDNLVDNSPHHRFHSPFTEFNLKINPLNNFILCLWVFVNIKQCPPPIGCTKNQPKTRSSPKHIAPELLNNEAQIFTLN